MGLEDHILKDLAAQPAREAVPEPPMLVFPSAMIDFPAAVDPVSGRPVMTMIITAGNNALRVALPLDPATTQRLTEIFTARAEALSGPLAAVPTREEPEYLRSAREAARDDNGDSPAAE